MLKLESKLKSNPSSFWSVINSKRNTTGFPASMEYDGEVSNSTQGSCNLFAKLFQKVYTKFASSQSSAFHYASMPPISCFAITGDDVLMSISKLTNSTKTDIEGFVRCFSKYARMLCQNRCQFSSRMCELWNFLRSMETVLNQPHI